MDAQVAGINARPAGLRSRSERMLKFELFVDV